MTNAKQEVELIQAVVQQKLDDARNARCFTVLAGSYYEDGEPNWKFISDFLTFEEALKEYDTVRDYHVRQIEHASGYIIESWSKVEGLE